jgi:hypothetical protein
MRFVFIGCTKNKHDVGRSHVNPEGLYDSDLFRKRVAYANNRDLPWAVLSARYGLWWPDTHLKTYENRLHDQAKIEQAAWHVCVAHHFLNYFDDDATDLRKITVEIHASKTYAHPLAEILRSLGIKVELPCEGLGIGQQLALYNGELVAA